MCVFIFAMSHKPADDSTEISMGFVWQLIHLFVPGYDQMTAADQLFWREALDHGVRKTAHFLEYMVLGILALNMLHQWFRARKGGANAGADVGAGAGGISTGSASADAASIVRHPMSSPRLVAASAWAIATLYAATDELHQIFVPGRTGKVTDILLDSAGALLGVLLLTLVLRAIDKRRARRQR